MTTIIETISDIILSWIIGAFIGMLAARNFYSDEMYLMCVLLCMLLTSFIPITYYCVCIARSIRKKHKKNKIQTYNWSVYKR